MKSRASCTNCVTDSIMRVTSIFKVFTALCFRPLRQTKGNLARMIPIDLKKSSETGNNKNARFRQRSSASCSLTTIIRELMKTCLCLFHIVICCRFQQWGNSNAKLSRRSSFQDTRVFQTHVLSPKRSRDSLYDAIKKQIKNSLSALQTPTAMFNAKRGLFQHQFGSFELVLISWNSYANNFYALV